jgi:hypothetical protein
MQFLTQNATNALIQIIQLAVPVIGNDGWFSA